MYISLRDVARIAANFGHTDLKVVETRKRRFKATCSCGYSSASRIKSADAAQAAAIHMRKAVEEVLHRSGKTVPQLVEYRAIS